ncbi:hypothetical protein BDA99DRAFT_525738 [Phascolomyces articulosus]|uniref:Uncharacterized protein n=1 Tax=Phascolomyces articulosus TaxID=60185 RepID=A0AAD5P8L1_9FUNG|nr:hypothetical protein BDA99DRAFT_525738 [Phascolomyces articulosus]
MKDVVLCPMILMRIVIVTTGTIDILRCFISWQCQTIAFIIPICKNFICCGFLEFITSPGSFL